MTRHRFSRLAVAATGSLALLSCGGNASSQARSVQAGEEVVAADHEAPRRAAEHRSVERKSVAHAATRRSSRDVLAYLSADRSIVVHLNWGKVYTSELFQLHRKELLEGAQSSLDDIRDKCAMDLLDAFDSVTLAMGQDPQDVVIAVSGNIGQSQLEECISRTGGQVVEGQYKNGSGESYHAYWPSENTLLLSEKTSAAEMQQGLLEGTVLDNQPVMGILRRTDSHAALWGGGVTPASAAGVLGGMGSPPTGFHFQVNVWSALDAVIALEFQSVQHATKMQELVKMAMQSSLVGANPAAQIFKALQVQIVDRTLLLEMHLGPQDVAEIIGLLD